MKQQMMEQGQYPPSHGKKPSTKQKSKKGQSSKHDTRAKESFNMIAEAYEGAQDYQTQNQKKFANVSKKTAQKNHRND